MGYLVVAVLLYANNNIASIPLSPSDWDGSVLDMLKDFASSPAGMGAALAHSYYMRASTFSPLGIKSALKDKAQQASYGQSKV